MKISSHGECMVQQLLLSSMAERVVRKAPMTIIAVKPQHIIEKLRRCWQ